MSKLSFALLFSFALLPLTRLAAQENESGDQPAVEGSDPQQQRGRGFRGRGGGRFSDQMLGYVPLLQIDSVKKELKVEGDQATQVESLTVQIREDFADEIRDIAESFRSSDPEDRQKFRAQIAGVAAKVNERLSTLLNNEQNSRLRQINLQLGLRRNGPAEALTSADIATALDLTPEQQEELGEQARDARRQRGREAKSLEEARQEANELLTPEQQEKLTNLLGEEFDLPASMLERGRGRGGFGGRGGGEGRRGLRQRPEAAEETEPNEAI